MAKKVVIPVSFQFDDISNQIQQAKNSLKAINIESNIGQQYSKAFAQIEKEIESIQKKASQGIASQSDINSFARSFQTITGYIERIQTLSRKINFNDINLTSEQVNQYKSLVQQLEKAKQNLSQFKREQIKNLFDNDQNFSQVLQNQLKISKESFTSQKQISDALNSQLKILQSQTAEKQAQVDKQKELVSMISATEGLFNKYGTTNSKGGMSFKSGQASIGREEILSSFSQLGINTDKLANASLNELIREWNTAKNLWSEVPKAIQTTEQELANLDSQQKQVVQAQEALNKAMSSGEYDKVSQEVKNASKSVEDYKTTVVQGAKETANGVGASSDKIIDSLNQQETELEKLQSQYSASVGAADLFSKMENGIKRLVGVSAVLIQVRKGVQEAVSQIKELDSAMNGIAVVTDFTTKQLWGQIDSYMAVAKQYGVTTTGVYQVSQLYYQQGQDVSSVNKLTAETLKMARIAGLDYATTTDYMTTALNGFKLSADDAGRVVNVYSKLASIAATDTAELAKAMSNTASIAESAGMSFESTSTFLTMMIE